MPFSVEGVKKMKKKLDLPTICLFLITMGVLGFILTPIWITVAVSFNEGNYIVFPPNGFSFRWYQEFFNDYTWMMAFKNSLWVATATMIISTAVGVLSALGYMRRKFPGRNLINLIIMMPFLVPGIIIGICLLIFLNKINLSGTYAAVVIGHCLWGIPTVFLLVQAVLAGYDFNIEDAARDLGAGPFVGSEGTLGIITRAILKLIPLPEARQTMTAAFPSLNQAAETVVDIIGSRVVPSALEFMDKHCIRAVDNFLKVGLPQDAQGFLLIETDGFASELPHAMEKITAICKANGAMDIRVAADENERQRLWKIRRSISAATSCFPIRGDGEDLVVPRTRIPDIIGKMDGICEKYGLFAINFGHAGDGNIHVSLVEKNGAVDMDKVNAASAEILKEAVKMEGRIAAEHGIGIVKKDKIEFNIDPATLDLMRTMKQTMDPNNILNPGKIFSFDSAPKR